MLAGSRLIGSYIVLRFDLGRLTGNPYLTDSEGLLRICPESFCPTSGKRGASANATRRAVRTYKPFAIQTDAPTGLRTPARASSKGENETYAGWPVTDRDPSTSQTDSLRESVRYAQDDR
jgi:hypothetical protein